MSIEVVEVLPGDVWNGETTICAARLETTPGAEPASAAPTQPAQPRPASRRSILRSRIRTTSSVCRRRNPHSQTAAGESRDRTSGSLAGPAETEADRRAPLPDPEDEREAGRRRAQVEAPSTAPSARTS